MFDDRSGAQRASLFKFVSGVKKKQLEAVDVSVPISELKYVCGSICAFP
jgi:hypothetical protein